MRGPIRSIGVTEVTYYRWRSEYGGLKGDQVKRLKELEAENTRLRRAVSDLTLEKLILKEAASGNFNSKLRVELLNGEIFYTLKEAKIVIEGWRRDYNTIRPHSSLGYKPPAPEVWQRPASQP